MRKILLILFCAIITMAANAQSMKNVKIQGDHGLPDAVIQKPEMKNGDKVRLAIICYGRQQRRQSYQGNFGQSTGQGDCRHPFRFQWAQKERR